MADPDTRIGTPPTSARIAQQVPSTATVLPAYEDDQFPPIAFTNQLAIDLTTKTLSYYDADGAWQGVTGAANAQTFYGPTAPVEPGLDSGDRWYDTVNETWNVWSETRQEWIPVAGDYVPPGNRTFRTPDDVIPPVSQLRIGDIWIKGEEGNTYYKWSVGDPDPFWQSVSDEQISQNADFSAELAQQLNDVSDAAYSAFVAASEAGSLVAMSDYDPDVGDIGNRTQGALWFVRTRPRTNFCVNPEAKVDTSGWSSAGTLTRVVMPEGIDYPDSGTHTFHVLNTTGGPGDLTYTAAIAVAPGLVYSASIHMLLDSGTGVGCYAQIGFYDSGDALIGTVITASADIASTEWTRLWVSGQAPESAATVKVSFHNPVNDDSWFASSALIEQDAEFGRYFDGDSFDASWSGTPNASTSSLEGDKVVRSYELGKGGWLPRVFSDSMLDSINATKILPGTLTGSLINEGSIGLDRTDVRWVTASENIAAGDLVHIYDSANNFRVRRASAASPGYAACGFVLDDVVTNGQVAVYISGKNDRVGSGPPGKKWLSATAPGQLAHQPPTSTGTLVQAVGYMAADQVLNMQASHPIKIV